jgi:hypothetical protein
VTKCPKRKLKLKNKKIGLSKIYQLSQGKKMSPLRRSELKISQHKNQIKIETPQNKENAFSIVVLDIFCRYKTT